VRGLPANHVLLYGERGTVKSSAVRGLLGRLAARGLRIVEVHKSDLLHLPDVLATLRGRASSAPSATISRSTRGVGIPRAWSRSKASRRLERAHHRHQQPPPPAAGAAADNLAAHSTTGDLHMGEAIEGVGALGSPAGAGFSG
jgi:hypothetical protein